MTVEITEHRARILAPPVVDCLGAGRRDSSVRRGDLVMRLEQVTCR